MVSFAELRSLLTGAHGEPGVVRADAASGVGEDPDFDQRFRHQRALRWARGVRNGMSLATLIRFRLGLSDEIKFHGVTVQQSPNQATYRTIEDIWMRGEWDISGFVPRRGWRVIEIGANVGVYAMLAASRGASVVAYEPTPSAFELLQANTAYWKVQCHRSAVVGAPRETVRLFVHPTRDTRNTLFGNEGGICNTSHVARGATQVVFDQSTEVSAVPITEVLAEPCDLLKVACEGAEFEIFAHARCVLPNARRIILELHSEMRTEHGTAEDLMRLVRDVGFDIQLQEPYPGTSRQFLTAIRRRT